MTTQYTSICSLVIFLFFPLDIFPQQTFDLDGTFKITSPDSSFAYRATAPFNVKNILYKNNKIDDLYTYPDKNTVEWIDKSKWVASMEFTLPRYQQATKSYLNLSGLNTYCDIYLNDKKLARTSNAFKKYSFYIDPYLRSTTNTLKIVFLPLDEKYLQLTQMDKNTIRDPSLLHRKSQIATKLGLPSLSNSIGILGNISVKRWNKARISDRFLNTSYEDKKGIVSEDLKIDLLTSGQQVIWERALYRPYLTRPLKIKRDTFVLRNETLKSTIEESPLNPWKLNTNTNSFYGYRSTLISGNDVLWSDSTSIAFRSIELENKNNNPQFVLNGYEEYIKGVTVSPFELFQDLVNNETYNYYFDLLEKSNVNLIRIPGYVSYVPEKFYDKCDSLGILIWHDFMFSSTIYPQSDEYISELKEEIEQVVKKAARHPSIAIWCGNNEVLKELNDSDLNTPLNRSKYIRYEQAYNRIFKDKIPSIIQKWDPDVPYIETTPSHNNRSDKGFINKSSYIKSNNVDLDGGFITSIGFTAIPGTQVTESYNLLTSFPEMNKKIEDAISSTFDYTVSETISMADKIYLSQILQYIGINSVLTHSITSYPDKRGVIYSQFNDPFPLISSSIVDYGGYPKAGFYSLQHNYSPVSVFLQNNSKSLCPVLKTPYREPINYNFYLQKWNTTTNRMISMDSAKISKDIDSIYHFNEMFEIDMKDKNTLYKLKCDYLGKSTYDFYINKGWSEIDYSPVSIEIEQSLLSQGKFRLKITSDAIGYFTELKASVAGTFSDNYFHITPNTVKTITFTASNSETELVNFTAKTLNEVILNQ